MSQETSEPRPEGITCLFTKDDWDVWEEIQNRVAKRTHNYISSSQRKKCTYPDCFNSTVLNGYRAGMDLCTKHIGWMNKIHPESTYPAKCVNCNRQVYPSGGKRYVLD